MNCSLGQHFFALRNFLTDLLSGSQVFDDSFYHLCLKSSLHFWLILLRVAVPFLYSEREIYEHITEVLKSFASKS